MHEGTYALNLFKKPPLEVFISIYTFNVTNGDRFLSGEDKKIIVEEIGPFTYREILTHHNITFNPNGTMSYVPHREVIFVPEKSFGDPKDLIIIVPNIPMLVCSYIIF